jgi:hypothetical protein
MASLSQGDGDEAATIHCVPAGFKVVDTEYGGKFICATCEVAVEP